MDRQTISFELGKRLKELRVEHDLSHETLIKQLNEKYGVSLSRDSIMAYEIADESRAKAHKLPNLSMRVETLYCLADFYGVSLDYLFGRTDTPVADMDTRDICEQTGLSVEAVEILTEEGSGYDFVHALIDSLIREWYVYQPAARTAASYWAQAKAAKKYSPQKGRAYIDHLLSMTVEKSDFQEDGTLRSFVPIPAGTAGDFYHDRAVQDVGGIVSKAIKEYSDTLLPVLEEMLNAPDDVKKASNDLLELYALAVISSAKDMFPDEFEEDSVPKDTEKTE